jgi:hypothetical protein
MEKDLGIIIANTLTDYPIGFTIGEAHFSLYPQTLGKIYLTSQIVDSLEIDKELLSKEPYIETLRLATTKKEDCCRLIAYHTVRTKAKALDNVYLTKRAKYFAKNIDEESIATLLIYILNDTTLDKIIKGTELNKEEKRMAQVCAAKKQTNTYAFGGKTIWGSIIDAVCERYGWTYDYAVWGISYNNLMIMFKDKVTTIYLTAEEAKHCRVPRMGEEVISGDDREAVMRMARESEMPH